MVRKRAGHPAVSVGIEQRYINREQLRELIPVVDMTIWRWERDPEIAFPAPVKLGADGRNYWWLPTVREWLGHRADRLAVKREHPRSPVGRKPIRASRGGV
jgi:predicted DNA-binding transcriptional regulator AlpA